MKVLPRNNSNSSRIKQWDYELNIVTHSISFFEYVHSTQQEMNYLIEIFRFLKQNNPLFRFGLKSCGNKGKGKNYEYGFTHFQNLKAQIYSLRMKYN